MSQNTGNEQTPVMWDVTTAKQLFRLDGLEVDTTCMYSPDGKRIVTYQLSRGLWQVRFWDATTGRELLTVHHPSTFPGARLSFSTDGHRIVRPKNPDRGTDEQTLSTRRHVRSASGRTYD